MIKFNEFQTRVLCLIVLVFANPLIQMLMGQIAHLQAYTTKEFVYLGQKLFNTWSYKPNVFTLAALSQIFWPLVLTLTLNIILKWMKKPELNHPNIYLCFIWLLFNGSYTLMR
jgi:ABC-type microcin C transport system permease subunit YejE